jgi:hypothetical protein
MIPQRNKKGSVNPEWYVTFVETLLTGIVLIVYAYITSDIYPNLPDTFSFPYYGIVLLVIGLISLFITRKRLSLLAILLNAGAWSWTFVLTATDVLDKTTPLKPFTAITAVLAACICVRILIYAKDTNLNK